MPLTSAERSRIYRQKLKQNPDKYANYLSKENERYKKRKEKSEIKLVACMSDREKRNARKHWRKRKEIQRVRKRMAGPVIDDTPPGTPTGFAGERDSTKRRRAGRRQVRRDRSKSFREVEKLKIKLTASTRLMEKYKKRLYRHTHKNVNENSPRTNTQRMLKGQKVRLETRKVLLFHNVLLENLKQKYKKMKSHKEKRVLGQVMRNNLLKKYRIQDLAQTALGTTNRQMSSNTKRNNMKRRDEIVNPLKMKVAEFLCREDNSRMKAGKKSTKTSKGQKKQIRLLTDTLKHLHLKYLSENVNSKISYSLFCRFRPFNVRHPNASDRETCLCKKHENVKFKADKLKQMALIASSDLHELSKTLVCDTNTKDCMYRQCAVCKTQTVPIQDYEEGIMVDCFEWKTKRIEKTKKDGSGTKLVSMTLKEKDKVTTGRLVKEFRDELDKCCKHLYNIKNQYQSIRNLKDKLTENDIILHIDFSENYACKYEAEIQSVHFGASQKQISLHTGVMYSAIASEGFCTISDDLRHCPGGIWAHMLPVLKYARNKNPKLDNLFVISDGPTTQYRCKDNFFMLSTVPFQLGFTAVNWSFMEAGHGKGAPDGIGAVVKREADRAVSYGHDITCAQSLHDTLLQAGVALQLFIVSKDDVVSQEMVIPRDLQVVTGTMKIHQIFTDKPGYIKYRDVSCFCTKPLECNCYNVQANKLLTSDAPAAT